VVIIVSTAEQVESYVSRAPKTARGKTAAAERPWTGKHRAESRRRRLGLGRMFYVARHRGARQH
jgi:hypothetical protein